MHSHFEWAACGLFFYGILSMNSQRVPEQERPADHGVGQTEDRRGHGGNSAHTDSPRPEHVVFDLGGVMFRWRPEEVLNRLFPSKTQRERLVTAMFRHGDWRDLDRGVINEHQAAKLFSRRSGVDFASILNLIQEARASLSLKEDTLRLARLLKADGIGIYCLSNLSHETWKDLRKRFDFWDVFDGMVLSCSVNLVKPDPRIYRRLLDMYRLDPKSTVFFDDLVENVTGARDLGILAYVFEGAEKAQKILREEFGLPLSG